MDKKAIIEETEKYYLPVFGRYPMVMELGQGCRVWDNEGNEYVDAFAGIAVNSLGYNHPVLVKAISEQASKLMHCSNLYYTEIQAKALRVVAEATGMDRIFFANCGAEGNEGAMKLARKYGVSKAPTKYKIISADESFHGRTFDTLAATGHDYYHVGYGPLSPGHVLVPYGDIKALEAQMDDDVCAVLLEPIQGEGGVYVPPDEYLQQVRALCDKHDALLIFDEIQTGMGRTGRLFAMQKYGVTPDIVCLAKAFGGGMPLGAFVARHEVMDTLQENPALGHITTFGGHPVCCAAGLAALNYLVDNKVVERVETKGALYEMLLKDHPAVREIRRSGLLLAVELGESAKLYRIMELFREAGILSDWFLFCDTAFRISPPLTISEDEVRESAALIRSCLDRL